MLLRPHCCGIVRSLFNHKKPRKLLWRFVSSAAMRLVQFHRLGDGGGIRVGVEQGEGLGVVDLKAFDPSMPSTMKELLELGDQGLECAERALSSGQFVLERSHIQLLAPVLAPEKVVCVGMNYRDHCLEQNAPIPKEPIIFSKFPSAITGPYDDIILPSESEEVDWEVELAFVIGRRGKHIKVGIAARPLTRSCEGGVLQSFHSRPSGGRRPLLRRRFHGRQRRQRARDWQMKRNGKQWLLGKTFDSFCPLGPAVDPHNLALRCLVNGESVQSSNTHQMIFKTEALVSWVSKFVTLTPGDVFLTGTPPGVGVFRKPPVYLKKGDVVECQIEHLGSIINKVV
ncbi:Fumarylacetoacetate hydrolase domain-containing protein 2 [Takifugu flavidus]|uniref:Fumarylacetoacetate hydrolase domain-containing protein 2 n=1 Tax=Takifugu flavidus TaxID=433684 RepID=A0A5C6N357_9TELE|nr:Fumarylacetoacetate hydrolase domain-containing protein 2 [Takifugu flavidus]